MLKFDHMSEKIKSFILESSTFNGLTFEGMYNMPVEHFFKLFDYYVETGDNLLDAYSTVVHLSWEKHNTDFFLDASSIHYSSDCIDKIRRLRIVSINSIYDAISALNVGRENYIKHKENSINNIRRQADNYIKRVEVRNEVFNLYGEQCLCCGDDDNITIDHVIPVSKGGENSIDNLQPLCRSCNSRKGTNKNDYRKEIKNDKAD